MSRAQCDLGSSIPSGHSKQRIEIILSLCPVGSLVEPIALVAQSFDAALPRLSVIFTDRLIRVVWRSVRTIVRSDVNVNPRFDN